MLFRAHAQTDKTKLLVAFHNFANRPKNIPACSKHQKVPEQIDFLKLNKIWISTGFEH
jgi:hypothetical protein